MLHKNMGVGWAKGLDTWVVKLMHIRASGTFIKEHSICIVMYKICTYTRDIGKRI